MIWFGGTLHQGSQHIHHLQISILVNRFKAHRETGEKRNMKTKAHASVAPDLGSNRHQIPEPDSQQKM
jgi:hypothetical protein